MKIILIIICLLKTLSSFSQEKKIDKFLKILETKSYCNIYLITGVDLKTNDTLHFISLIEDSLPSNARYEKINVGMQYLFKIKDMDYVNGYYTPTIADGYRIKYGYIYVKREARNGKTITTTQYLAKNTNGLFIKQE